MEEQSAPLSLAEWITQYPDFTQQAFAGLVIRAMDGNFMWLPDRHCWAYWTGRVWDLESPRSQLAEMRITQEIAQEIGYIPTDDAEDEDAEDYARRLRQWKVKIKSDNYQNGAINMAKPGVARKGVMFDTQELINTPDYVVTLPDLKIREQRKIDFCTRLLGTTPDHGECPHWMKFIDEITCGDKELADYLQCLAGYAMTPWLSEPSVFICYGKGRNGKTVFFSILRKVLGGYIIGYDKTAIVKGEKPSKDWALPDLEGARMVIVAETGEGDLLDINKIKALTGGESVIKAEAKFGSPFDIAPRAKWIIYTNYRMKIKGGDTGTWRRVMEVPFRYVVPENKIIPREILEPMLLAELPQIAAWALQGLRKYIENDHHMPVCKAVLDCTNEYRMGEDIVLRFLIACPHELHHRGLKDLHDCFKRWVESEEGANKRVMGKRAFREELEHHMVELYMDGRGYWWVKGDQISLLDQNGKSAAAGEVTTNVEF